MTVESPPGGDTQKEYGTLLRRTNHILQSICSKAWRSVRGEAHDCSPSAEFAEAYPCKRLTSPPPYRRTSRHIRPTLSLVGGLTSILASQPSVNTGCKGLARGRSSPVRRSKNHVHHRTACSMQSASCKGRGYAKRQTFSSEFFFLRRQ